MTTPSVPVFNDNFDTNYASGWGDEWSFVKLSSQTGATSSVSGGRGIIAPDSFTVTSSPGVGVLSAMRWKDSELDSFELEVDLYHNADGSSSRAGLLLCWDGSIDNANGYLLHPEKITATSGNFALYKITNGVAASASIFSASSSNNLGNDTFSIFVRVTPSATGIGRRIEFAAVRPENYNDPLLFSYSIAVDTPAASSPNYIGVANTYDYNSTAAGQGYDHTIDSTNTIGCDRFYLRRLAGGWAYPSEAPTVSTLTSGGSTTDGTTFATASISPSTAPEKTWLAFVKVSGGSPNLNTTTLSGAGLTWTSLASTVYGANTRRLTLFRGTGTPTSGALTIGNSASATMTGAIWAVLEISGASTDNATTLPTTSLDGVLLSPVSASGAGTSTTATATVGGRLPDATPEVLLLSAVAIASASYATTTALGATTTNVAAIANPTTSMTLFTNRACSNTTIATTLPGSVAYGQIIVAIQPSLRYIPDDIEGTVSTGAYQ